MTDRALRDLERRAAAGDAEAEAGLDRALERAGATAAFEADLEAALARVQRGGDRATLHRLEVAHALRDLLARRDGPSWRLALADPSAWPREPLQTYAAVTLSGEDVLVALGRAETAQLARDLPRGVGFDEAALRAVSEPGRFEVLRGGLAVARAWARADRASGVTDALREAVRSARARPAMYLGSVDARGLERLLDDALAVALDEAYLGHAREVTIARRDDGGWSIEDDGRPLELRSPAWTRTDEVGDRERLLAHDSPVLERSRLGLALVGALCRRLEVESHGGGRLRRHAVERGLPVDDAEGPSDRRGVTLRLWPDPAVFGSGAAPRLDRVVHRARELAHLLPGLRLGVVDEAEGTVSPHHAPGGLGEWLAAALPRDALGPIVAAGEREDPEHGLVRVAAAVAWAPDPRPSARRFVEEWQGPTRRDRYCVGWVNARLSDEEGSHVEGLRRGATIGAARLGVDTDADRWREGLVGLVSVFAHRVTLHGHRAGHLAEPGIGGFVTSLVASAVRAWGRDHPDEVAVLRREVSRERRRGRR